MFKDKLMDVSRAEGFRKYLYYILKREIVASREYPVDVSSLKE